MADTLVETSRFVPESQAILAFVAPETFAQSLLNFGELTITHSTDSWSEQGWGSISGHTEEDDKRFPVSLYVSFPGLMKSYFSRIRHKEPSAVVSLTIRQPSTAPEQAS